MDGEPKRLAPDIPQGEVERANGIGALAASGIEVGAIHILPQGFNELGIAADETSGRGSEHVLGAAFADAGDPGVRLDSDNHVALVEERVRIGR